MEDNTKTMLDNIEKLIINGNKQLKEDLGGKIGQLDQKFDLLETKVNGLDVKFDRLGKKVDRLDRNVETNARAAYDLLTDVQNDLKAHLRVPHAV